MDRCPICQRVYCTHYCTACGGAWKNCEGTRCGGYQPGQLEMQQQQAAQNRVDPRYTGPSVVLNEINMVGDFFFTLLGYVALAGAAIGLITGVVNDRVPWYGHVACGVLSLVALYWGTKLYYEHEDRKG